MVVVAMVVVFVLLLLVEVFGAAVELASMGMLPSLIVELLCPSPNVKREPVERSINS